MLGEDGRGQTDVRRRLAHAPVRAVDFPDAGDGMRDGLEEAAGAQVWVGEDFWDAKDGHRGDARRLKGFCSRFLRSIFSPSRDDFVECVLIAIAADDVGEAGIAGEARLLEW